MSPSPLAAYRHALNQGFAYDGAQERAALALEQCFQALEQGETPQGLYLWGQVGRGKTWLMDNFYNTLSVPAKRQHFHHFLAWLHQRLFALTGTENPLTHIAQELRQEIKVLCFDELFISDIGDAMLLGPLFQALFEQGVVLIATSNQAPEQLYANGFNRERFLPAITAITTHCQTVHLEGTQDHRLTGEKKWQRYFVQIDLNPAPMAALFFELTGQKPLATELIIQGRTLAVLGAAQEVLWADFAHLCAANLAASDYMALCQNHRHIMLSNIPKLSATQQDAKIARGTEDAVALVLAGGRTLPALARNDNAVRRFIALVDECYDQGVTLSLQAAVPLEELYREGALLAPFARTLSRIEEMQRK